jgi:hypothetical protein
LQGVTLRGSPLRRPNGAQQFQSVQGTCSATLQSQTLNLKTQLETLLNPLPPRDFTDSSGKFSGQLPS